MGRLSIFFQRLKVQLTSGAQNLTHVYLYALTSIALMALVFNAIKFGLYTEQGEAIKTVREIERQLIASDQLHSHLLDLQLSSNWKAKETNLRATRESAESFFSGKESIENFSFFDEFCESRDCSSTALTALSQVHDSSLKMTNEWSEDVQAEIKSYKALLEQANLYLDDSTSQTNQDLILLDIAFLVCLLIFLIFQATFIFKPAVSRLDQALSIRSEFLSRISHEIRNPMNAVLGMAEVLKGTKLNLEQRQYLDSLLRAGQTLLEMLNNLIEVSAVEGKKIKIKSEVFQTHQMIDKASQVVSSLAHQKGIEFFVKIDPQIKKSYLSDVGRLEQVIINLLNNAVKFTPKGYVLLQLELVAKIEQKSRIRFSVKDTGIGIDESKTKEIFDSFVQEDSSIKRKYGGSGLGLSIASELLLMMDSQLNVESKKGVGSTFYFEIDLLHNQNEDKGALQQELLKPTLLFTGQFSEVMSSVLNDFYGKHYICENKEDFTELLSLLDTPSNVVVDDSVGIINMIYAAEKVAQQNTDHSLVALLKTSFPKENIDLVRNAGYSNFMLKPLRPWVLSSFEAMDHDHVSDNPTEASGLFGDFDFQIKVLAVDDSEDNLFLIREILNPMVQKIDFARNGQEAIDLVTESHYDIIFMDIQMPVMDGYTAIRHIRKIDEKNTPVIAVTAHGGVIDEKKCLEAGFSARLVKPIGKTALKKILQEFYNHKAITKKTEVPMSQEEAPIDPLIKKLLPTFFATRDTDLDFVKQALEKKDFDQLKELGHKVKGSSLSYGFESLGKMGKDLEEAALEHDLERCHELYNQLFADLSYQKEKHLSP